MSFQQSKGLPNDIEFRPLRGLEPPKKPNSTLGSWKYGAAIAIFCVIGTINMVYFVSKNNEVLDDGVINEKRQPVRRHLDKRPSCGKRIVGYYTEFESIDITKTQISKLTHVIFAYIGMDYDGKIRLKSEMAESRFESLKRKSKSAKNDVKVMISIGGQENNAYFKKVAESTERRRTFVKSIAKFLKLHEIDGVDLYWKNIQEADKWNYITMIKEIRQELDLQSNTNHRYIISVTLPAAGVDNWEMSYDLEEIQDDVDFFNVFSMDYAGPWENKWGVPAGPIANLYAGVGPRTNFNVDYTMKYYVCKARNPNKFNIAIPFFVRSWKHVNDAIDGKGVFRNADLVNGKAVGNPYMSRWTANDKKFNLTDSTWDEESKSSYIYDTQKKTYVTFETKKSIQAKTAYVNEKNLGGVWIWSVDMDNDQPILLDHVASDEFCSTGSGTNVRYPC